MKLPPPSSKTGDEYSGHSADGVHGTRSADGEDLMRSGADG